MAHQDHSYEEETRRRKEQEDNRYGRPNPFRSGHGDALFGRDWGQADAGVGEPWGNQGNWGNEGYYQGFDSDDDARGGHGSRNVRVVIEKDWARPGRFAGVGPKGYQRSDERIWEEINDRLTDNPDIDATHMDVTVTHGEVRLAGAVESRGARRLAEEIADSVRGVREVHNELRVETPQPQER